MAPPGRYSRKRAVLSFDRAQLGDLSNRDSAGGDINQVDPRVLSTILQFLEGDRHSRDLFAASIEYLGNQLDAHELMQTRRNEADVQERAQRREELDAALAELHRGQRIARRWLAGITGVLAAVLAAVVWLLWRELGPPPFALFRLALGGALALVGYWRGR